PAVAATSPPVLIPHLATQTSQLRLGSGGVMLPNHAPLAVAEQFALLEAAHPGRIDLGIGRAPGSDPVTSLALRGAAGRDDRDIEAFPEYLDDVVALMSARGVRVPLRRRPSRSCGCWARRCTPPIWPRPRGCRTCSPTTSRGRAPPRRSRRIARSSGRVTWRPNR